MYRVYNPNAKGGDHYYTKSKAEATHLVSIGWKWDNGGAPVFYSAVADTQAVWVAYNPNAQSGAHNYTTNNSEEDSLISAGWTYPDVAWSGTTGNYSWNDATKTIVNESGKIKIGAVTKVTDWQGKAAVRVNYTATNTTKSSQFAGSIFSSSVEVYQNGKELADMTALPNFPDDNYITKLAPGGSVSGYYLVNTNGSGTVSISVMADYTDLTSFSTSIK